MQARDALRSLHLNGIVLDPHAPAQRASPVPNISSLARWLYCAEIVMRPSVLLVELIRTNE